MAVLLLVVERVPITQVVPTRRATVVILGFQGRGADTTAVMAPYLMMCGLVVDNLAKVVAVTLALQNAKTEAGWSRPGMAKVAYLKSCVE